MGEATCTEKRSRSCLEAPQIAKNWHIFSQVLNESEDPIVLRVTDVDPVVKRTRKVSYQRTL